MRKVYEKEFYEFIKKIGTVKKDESEWFVKENGQDYIKISNLTIKNFDFSGRSFKNMIFNNVQFENVNLINCFFERGTRFINCKFKKVDFRFSVFKSGTFFEPYFFECDFYSSEFEDITFAFSNIRDYELAKKENYFFFNQCPERGNVIGWKKVSLNQKEKYLVMLLIQDGEHRRSETTEMCKCSNPKVIGMQGLNGEKVKYLSYIEVLKQLYKQKEQNELISFYIDREVAKNNDF